MPFFKKLKSSVFSSFGANNSNNNNKSSSSSYSSSKKTTKSVPLINGATNHHINGYLLNTAPSSLATATPPTHSDLVAENDTAVTTAAWLNDKNNSSAYQSHNQTLNTTTSSSNNNPNNTTLSSLNSTSFFGGKKEPVSSFRRLNIYHIDSETEGDFSLTVPNEANGDFVMDKVCNHYNVTSYKEYFGLKYSLVDEAGDYEVFWLDPFKSVGKQLRDTNKNSVLTFRIKHFPGRPELIESEYVRYLIFLQLRNYLLKSGDLHMPLREEIRLAGYAVQAALGDYDPSLHSTTSEYLSECKFLSNRVLNGETSSAIADTHRQLAGKTPGEMELAFLETVSKYDTYGAELIVVRNSKGVQINFGASHNGIITYLSGQAPSVAKINVYPWTQIGKISCDGKTLRIHAHTPNDKNSEIINKHVMVFKCNSKRICKHLWTFVLDQKAFFNFKRGADVPKIKSSKSFFMPKSKFRFSGRCESELISSQRQLVNNNNGMIMDTTNNHHDQQTINNLSPISNTSMLQIDTAGMDNNNTTSFYTDNSNNQLAAAASPSSVINGQLANNHNRYSTLQPSFKRRTFLSMSKTGSLIRFTKPTSPSVVNTSAAGSPTGSSGNDANNNLLLDKVGDQNNSNNNEPAESSSSRKNTLTEETSSNKSQLTVIVSNDFNEDDDDDDDDVIVIKTPVTGGDESVGGSNVVVVTSTPNSEHRRGDSSEMMIKVNGTVNGTTACNSDDQTLRQEEENEKTTTRSTTSQEEEEDKFYDYREISDVTMSSLNNENDEKRGEKRREPRRTSNKLYSVRLIVLTFFFMLFVCMLVEYVYCSVTHRHDQVYSCAGHMINTIRNNLLAAAQSSATYISWVNVADEASLSRLDPLIAWFLGRRTPPN